jgi:hypothetical protein
VATLPDCGPDDTLAFVVPVCAHADPAQASSSASSTNNNNSNEGGFLASLPGSSGSSLNNSSSAVSASALGFGNLAASVFGGAVERVQPVREHTHEISVELLYRKVSKEKKLINQVMDLVFVTPFSFSHKVIPVDARRFDLGPRSNLELE